MGEIRQWYEEASAGLVVHSALTSDFMIYKGFKLSVVDGNYILEDVRFSNMYSKVKEADLTLIKEHGFIKGVDIIGFNRDSKRVSSYKARAEKLYDKRRKCKNELPKNKALNEKRIRNINKRIDDYIDLLFFYDTRIKQFHDKYKD